MAERLHVQKCTKPGFPWIDSVTDMVGVNDDIDICEDLQPTDTQAKVTWAIISRLGIFSDRLLCNNKGCQFHEEFQKKVVTKQSP